MFVERRNAPRAKLQSQGWLLVAGASDILNCQTVDLSMSGAKIEVSDPSRLPNEFELAATEHDFPRPCRVRWRSDRQVGVMFLDETSTAFAFTLPQAPA